MKRARLLLSLTLSAMAGAAGQRRRALAPSGVAGAVIVGCPVFYGGGAGWAAVLFTFFGSSSFLSQRRAPQRSRGDSTPIEARGSERDIVQALANGGIAAAAALLYSVRPNQGVERAFAGSFAAANADTWATEIGKTSRRPPRMINTGEIAPPGTSGAVSLRGLLASIGGSATVALVAAAVARSGGRARHFLAVSVGGIAGSLADSMVGATIQAAYRCPTCGTLTERKTHACGTPTVLVSGRSWCTNDVVNLACTATGALAAAILLRDTART